MTDTDSSSTPIESPIARNEAKKTKKKKRKKHRHDAEAEERGHTHVMLEENDNDDIGPIREKKSKKKKKKTEKRKRSGGIDDTASLEEDEDGRSSSSTCSSNRKKSKKKKHKKSSKRSKEEKRKNHNSPQQQTIDGKLISSSATEYYPKDLKHLQRKKNQPSLEEGDDTATAGDGSATKATSSKSTSSELHNVTLLLFYQYVEPPWSEAQFKAALSFVTAQGRAHDLTGRMRVAREGLNCTLTGSRDGVRAWCAALRRFDGGRPRVDPASGEAGTEFAATEFKLTDDLPPRQRFPKLHPFEVAELVNYGLAGGRAPAVAGGTHLEPDAYHRKMCEEDTVVIDVRNHYEANIGRFAPPAGGAAMIDPRMRKSTEFPRWLDRKETKELLRGKQVLMYCTGGVRCERASALLKQKIETEEDTAALGIKGVYQLQGGVDKYFKQFPAGGLWKGKNYTFDKRFAHAPPAVEAVERTKKALGDDGAVSENGQADGLPAGAATEVLGRCEACSKPWDMYRGKRRCPTCGVPSLVCRDCFTADRAGTRRLGEEVRCDLCVEEGVSNKRELRKRVGRETREYEAGRSAAPRRPQLNPDGITRLFLKNLCAKRTDEGGLLEVLRPARVTHIQWLLDRQTRKFYGSAFIEVKTPEDAGSVLALDGAVVLGRTMKVKYQKADEKDVWPIPNTEVPSS